MSVKYVPSQPDATRSTGPLQYTQSPVELLWYDVKLFLRYFLPTIFDTVIPLTPWGSGALDELYPSPSNIFDLAFHTVLIVAQLGFLLSLPLFFTVPLGIFSAWVAVFLIVNKLLCRILNGKGLVYYSNVNLDAYPKHDDESWIFINGVSVGQSWLQSNLDRLSLTFRRPITGIHNLTYGIVFDVIECLIQRDLSYATDDTRCGYAKVKEHLDSTKYKKVVLILHSQGGIEGCQILDWLLADLPEDLTRKLEIYTFGNAANHFNNPVQAATLSTITPVPPGHPNPAPQRVLKHIEHYANLGDPVAVFGVLNFIYSRAHDNRFVGKLFGRSGKGHMLNQHYLDNMFTLDPKTWEVLEHNPFMDGEMNVAEVMNGDVDDHVTPKEGGLAAVTQRVRDLSRLWAYRNGHSPKD